MFTVGLCSFDQKDKKQVDSLLQDGFLFHNIHKKRQVFRIQKFESRQRQLFKFMRHSSTQNVSFHGRLDVKALHDIARCDFNSLVMLQLSAHLIYLRQLLNHQHLSDSLFERSTFKKPISDMHLNHQRKIPKQSLLAKTIVAGYMYFIPQRQEHNQISNLQLSRILTSQEINQVNKEISFFIPCFQILSVLVKIEVKGTIALHLQQMSNMVQQKKVREKFQSKFRPILVSLFDQD